MPGIIHSHKKWAVEMLFLLLVVVPWTASTNKDILTKIKKETVLLTQFGQHPKQIRTTGRKIPRANVQRAGYTPSANHG